jgi:hypothetical protein
MGWSAGKAGPHWYRGADSGNAHHGDDGAATWSDPRRHGALGGVPLRGSIPASAAASAWLRIRHRGHVYFACRADRECKPAHAAAVLRRRGIRLSQVGMTYAPVPFSPRCGVQ